MFNSRLKNCRYRNLISVDQPVVNNLEHKECDSLNIAWKEAVQNDNDVFWVINVTTLFDDERKEIKKLLTFPLGKNMVPLNIQVDPANPLSSLKTNVLHESCLIII